MSVEGGFIKNDWTNWAKDRDVNVFTSAVPHRRKTGMRIGGAITFKDKDSGYYYFRREDWVSKSQWKVSVHGYSEGKNMFGRLSLPGDKIDDLLDFIKAVKIC